jgi:polysaccharide deacetylase family protein (PEP-CTERM system associated)
MAASNTTIVNALSFDIEDWFHLVEIPAVGDPNLWPSLPSIVEKHTDQILELCAQMKVRATFFFLGWVAKRHPQLAKRIADAGHEVGTHSFWHRRVDQLTPQEFGDDLRESIQVLEDQSGKKVFGFRAPSFSITPGAEWAFDVMREQGLTYDASLFPAPRGHGGYPCQQEPHVFERAPSGIGMPELPMSVMRAGPLKLPFSGGGYFRLLPLPVIERGFSYMNHRGWPAVIYLHPRDFAPDCPRVPMPLHRRFKCYIGLQTTMWKLRMMLIKYRFDTCAAVLEANRCGTTALAPAPTTGGVAPTVTEIPE